MRMIFIIVLIVISIIGSLAGLGVFAYSRYVENISIADFLDMPVLSDSFSVEDLQGNLMANIDSFDQEYLKQLPQYIEGVDSVEELQNLDQEELQQLEIDSEGLKSFSQEYFQENFDSINEVFQAIDKQQSESQDSQQN